MLSPCCYTPFNVITSDYNYTLVDKRKWSMTEKVWLGLCWFKRRDRDVPVPQPKPPPPPPQLPLRLPAPPPHRPFSVQSIKSRVLTVLPIREARTFSLFSAAKTLPNIVGWIKYPRTIFQLRISLAFSMPDLVIMELRQHQSGFSEVHLSALSQLSLAVAVKTISCLTY